MVQNGGIHVAVLRRAAEMLGDKAHLRAYLNASSADLDAWLDGARPVPAHIFLKAVDLVTPQATPAESLSRELRSRLDESLRSAVNATSAARGNIQLVSGDHLRIVSSLGFEKRFLDFFSEVRHDTPSSCGPARERARRIIVPEVATDRLFQGTPAAAVMDRAGARACQSTPLVSRSGQVVGMLNTHYEAPHEPSAEELQAIDAIAQRAASWLEHVRP